MGRSTATSLTLSGAWLRARRTRRATDQESAPRPDPLRPLKEELRRRAEHLPWLEGTLGLGLSQVLVQVEVAEDGRGLGRGEEGRRRLTLLQALDDAARGGVPDGAGPLDGPGGAGPGHGLREARDAAGRGGRGLATASTGARLALIGAAGSGKSTLLKQLVIDLLKKEVLLPLLFHVQHAVEHRKWEDAFVAVYGEAALLLAQARVAAGTAVLLLDGLDEASVPARGAGGSVEAVDRWARAAGASPLLVASREEGFLLPRGFTQLRVLPLEDEKEQVKLLTRLKVSEEDAEAAVDALGQDEHRKALLQNPMMLTLVGLVLLRDGSLPERRADLYERAVTCLIKRGAAVWDTPQDATIHSGELTRQALETICGALHASPRDPWPVTEVCRALRDDRDLVTELCLGFGSLESWLQDQAKKVGLLLPVSVERGAGYGVPHRTLREYLAACGLVRACEAAGWPEQPPEALAEVLRQAKAKPGAWAELLSLAVARAGVVAVEQVDRLLGWVVGLGDLDVGWRVAREAARMSAETARKLWAIGRGSREWQERFEDRAWLLQRLPDLLEDLGEAVALIRELSRQTSHGADLLWARWTLLEIATGRLGEGPAQARSVASVEAERVFAEHRPAEREQALKLIEERGWWKRIPAGSFWMGSDEETDPDRWDDEGPRHRVELKSDFELLSVPVTNALFEFFDPDHRKDLNDFSGKLATKGQSDVPVYNVSWYEAWSFAAWLDQAAGREGRRVRLPTETEWEYACRGGTETRFWSGQEDSDLEAVDWVGKNSGGHPHPVATPPKPRGHAHPWGLHDLHGNVWEWCEDAWVGDHSGREPGVSFDSNDLITINNPTAPRVIRGGCWGNLAQNARSACRGSGRPSNRDDDLGFRLLRVLPE